ncbi:serine-rich adhesin for platelets-like isoform X2 [Hermetia illucens]|nr:serine-rich adhesin for platelets-like isoform X2 [Hermetia illucens]
MFYLSHPFGVVSPSSGSDAFKSRTFSSYPGRDDQIVSGDNDDGDGNDALYQRRRRKQLGEKPVVLNRTNARRREDWSGNLTGCNHDARTTSGLRDSSRMRSGHLIPWPRDTWRREFVLPPLIQFRGKQKDEATAPDLEVILRTIRQAWNSPYPRSNLQSRSYEDTDTPTSEWNIPTTRNFGVKFRQQQKLSDISKMGSGNNSTPVISGLLRRRYSVPEIIMRKHSLAQQKSFDESSAATAPSPNRSPAPVYHKSYSTNTPTRTYPLSSGSDSNLSLRRFDHRGGEMSMRKSTLLRRIWSRELKRYDDTRSGSWSPPMRRSQRRLHPEPVEQHRCEECRKLEDDHSDESEELVVGASRKRLRLISSHGKEAIDQSSASYHTSSANYTQSTSERTQITTPNNGSLESTPLKSASTTTTTSSSIQKSNNVHIYMTPIKSDQSNSEPIDQGQDMLHVEIDVDNSETNGNSIQMNSDENQNEQALVESPQTVVPGKTTTVSGTGDSPLDKFISKLLIDNLADLADEINEQFENNNNLMRNTSTPKSKRVSVVYLTPEHMEAVVSRSQNSTTDNISSDSNNLMITTDSSNNERIIYFPSCSLECKDDMSSFNSNCSDIELHNISGESLVTVNAGSAYLQNAHTTTLVVPRMLNKFPRTESLEAEYSLTSAREEEEDNANGNDTDDSVSLVDSLDEPHPSSNNNENSAEKTEEITDEPKTEPNNPDDEEADEEENTPSMCREPEAFFIPIAGSESEKVRSGSVSEAMPEKLKERIIQRQRELDKKKIEEHRKKQKKLEELIDPKLEEQGFTEKSPVRLKKDSPVKEKPPVPKKSESLTRKLKSKSNAIHLHTEISLLESYTIDSKGNMQMRAPQQKTESTSTGITSTSGATKKLYPSKSKIQRKQSMIAPKPPEIAPSIQDRKPLSSSSHNKSRSQAKRDVQKMTIFQAQSDIITPDSENGPRRVYQKTEIQDGEKHIEILEIVECIESSPESSPDRHQTYRCSSKSALSRRSKIPIPVYKMGRSSGYQKAIRCPLLREASPNSVKCIARNLQTSSCNKVDRVIAELLIDALNRPEEIGIEIIKSPKDLSRDKSSKRQNNQRRNTPRRSANNTKYQQVFEVIPEEKSSFSVDSSTDDATKSSSTKARTRDSSSTQMKTSDSTAPTKELNELPTESSSSTSATNPKSSTTSNPGRLAVDHAEPNAWIGFFRRHDSSMDEDDSPSQPYPNSTAASSCQPTISSPSTNTAAAGTTTPKDISSAECLNSAESDNVLKLIDKTFQNSTKSKIQAPSKPASSLDYVAETATTAATIASGTTSTITSETFSNTCNSCKLLERKNGAETCKNIENAKPSIKSKKPQSNALRKSNTVLKIDLKQSSESSSQSSISSTSTTAEASSSSKGSEKPKDKLSSEKAHPPDVWRVQSPDICKKAIPKLKGRENEPSTCETMTEIDTKSFIIIEDSCNMSPSTLNYSANIPTKVIPTSTDSNTPILTNKCTICCFCNPDLHKSGKTTSSTPCPYCNRRRTPPKREEETNTESDYFLSHPFYQSMTKFDHTHIRTRSRDSDVISTKCTKVNEKIKNYNFPEGTASQQDSTSKSRVTKNLSRPKNTINIPKRAEPGAVHKTTQDTIKSKDSKMKNSSPDRKAFRLPSPYANLSSTSFERTSSPSSSSDSTCPTTPSRCPILPSARRHNFAAARSNSKEAERRKEKHPAGKATAVGGNNNESVSDNANNNGGSNNAKVNGQTNGWSVTVAGSYNQDMAPDLEMRLSFPKPGGSGGLQHQQQSITSNQTVHQNVSDRREIHHHQRVTNGNNIYSESHYQDEDLLNDNFTRSNNHHQFQALPPAGNPKRTLTRIVSERTHSQRDINFPEVSPSSRNPIASRQMAKKAIKHTECSVAVTSATRTISNFTRGRRTMSYQSLNTAESLRTNTNKNTNNNRDRHLIRDNSLDLGNLSSGRRMSLESQTPSATECLALSVMGNAIAPEQKPRVLTMSEKDLTRRHHSCFTRNRAFFT